MRRKASADEPRMPQSFKIDAASQMNVVDSIQHAAELLGIQEGLGPDASHFFSLALREAVVNAIRHGNRGDPNRRVHVSFRSFVVRGKGKLVFTVGDEGSGFDPAGVPDPREPENLDRGGGRGVFYMHQFADRVDFTFPDAGGTVVRLEKNVTSR